MSLELDSELKKYDIIHFLLLKNLDKFSLEKILFHQGVKRGGFFDGN